MELTLQDVPRFHDVANAVQRQETLETWRKLDGETWRRSMQSKTCSICSSDESELSTHFASEHCRCGNSRRKGKSNSSLPRSAGPRCSSNWKHVITCGYRGCPRPCRFNSSHTHESHLRDSTVPNGYGNLRGWAVHLIILLCGL